MPEYYNVIQAAKYIGADPKTVRRWLKQGKLTGTRTERGWLAIPAELVEWMKFEWENEQKKFDVPSPPHASLDLLTRVEALEQRVTELEQALSNASLPVPTSPYTESLQSQNKPLNYAVDKTDVQPQQSTLSSLSSANRDDLLTAVDFSKKIGIKHTILEGMIRRDQLECTRIPHPAKKKPDGTPTMQYYFTPPQQAAAMEVLKRHGKI